MSTEPAQVRIMREALEAVLPPKLAQAVLFEALSDSQRLPSTSEELLKLVRGPMQDAVRKRSGNQEAAAVVACLEGILGRRPSSRPPPPPDGETTVAVPVELELVSVLVISAGPWFGGRLAAALGPGRVSPIYASDEVGIRSALLEHAPALVVIDATDFPPLALHELTAALEDLPATSVAAIWGGELPYGRRAAFAFEERGIDVMAFRQKGGIDPLLDVIRARRSQ